MKPRTKLLFKINNKVILEESTDLYLNQIDELKWGIALDCECSIDDIEVETVEMVIDASEDVDVTVDGLVFWKSLYMQPIQGVSCDLEEGSDEYLDAINNGTLINHLNFFI
jgi:hypothetical protein